MWSTPYTVALEVFSPLPNMVVLQFCGIKDGSLRNWAVHGGSFARIIWRTKPSPCLQFTMWPLAFLVLKAGISGWFQLCVGSDDVKKTHHFFWCQVHQSHQLLKDPFASKIHIHCNLAHRITRFCRSSPAYGYKITLEKLFFEALHCFLALNEIFWLCQQTFRWWVFSAWNIFFQKKKRLLRKCWRMLVWIKERCLWNSWNWWRECLQRKLVGSWDGWKLGCWRWVNYSDRKHDRFPPNGGLVREIPLFQGNLVLVKYYNLARSFVSS